MYDDTSRSSAGRQQGAGIRRLRERLGLTQASLAQLLGVSFVTISRWENGQARPSTLARQQLKRLEQERLASLRGTRTAGDEISVTPLADDAEAPRTDFLASPGSVIGVAEAERLSFGHLFNPAFAVETSLIEPLPHQRITVYERMLKESRLRFLLADDAGAGKTIMAGLYVREMLARRLIRRILIVPPAGLIGNWERELRTLFSLDFRIVRGADAKAGNPFVGPNSDRVICSIDTLAGDRMFGRLKEAEVLPYDLVIFDEAHKLSADREPDLTIRKTDRYRLGEALAGVPEADSRWALPWQAQHLLLLTATPHMGKDYPYYCLWRLLEPEMLPTIDAFNAYPPDARGQHFIRRTKEEMVRFDGTPLYPRRESNTLSYDLGQGETSEQTLYDETTRYMETFYNAARILNRSAAKLAMSVFQRRLASSTYALARSFERRLERLDVLIDQLRGGRITPEQMAAAQRRLDELDDPFDATTADEEGDEDGHEAHELTEEKLLGVIVTKSLGELEAERGQVVRLLDLAKSVLHRQEESKFEKLREVLIDPRYRDEKLIIFTEHRDTLEWLTQRLEAMGFTDKVASLHGGMDFRERERQVEFFRKPAEQGGAQYLIATDAAGEGINLQFCWLMVNYDIPWNPARLEQRMGRIHRFGQKHDPVIIVNLVAGKTHEGRVLKTLLEKLERIRKELRSDKVFDVVGRLFENVRITDFMASALTETGADEATQRIEGILTPEQVEALEAREKVLFGEGGEVDRELPRLRSQLDIEFYHRLLPGYVRQFVARAAKLLDATIEGDLDGTFALRPRKAGGLDPLWEVLEAYPDAIRDRLTVYRPKDKNQAIFLHPGEPLFERLREYVLNRFAAEARRGAVFVDPSASRPYMFHLAEVTVVRREYPAKSQPDVDEVLECRLVGMRHEDASNGDLVIEPCPVEHLLLLRGADRFPPANARFASKAQEFIIRANEYAIDRVALPLAAERKHSLLESQPAREEFLNRGYDSHDAELASSRARLTEKARGGNVQARKALERVKEQQRSLAERRAAAVAELRLEPERIAPGSVRFIAHTLVVPSSDPEDRKRHDADVEAVAMQVAQAYEEARGAIVKDVSTPPKARAAGLGDNPGFDLWSLYPDGTRRAIEVKGRAAIGDIEVTENEWAKACNLRDGYWLYTVFHCASPHPQITRVRDPFGKLLARAKGSVVIDERAILTAGETAEEPEVPGEPLPEDLRPLFWDHDFAQLAWPASRELVIARILQNGGDDALRWLRQKFGDSELRAWILRTRGRGLEPKRLRFWQLVLDLPAKEVDRWVLETQADAWMRRT